MSKLITNTIRHTSGSADNITLDSSQNVTVEGNLTVDGTNNIVGGATGTDFNDDVKVRFGSDQDLDVWHDGTDGQVDLSTGYLKIRDVTNSRDIAKFHSSNSQEFYMNGTKRMEVTNTGISVTGSVTVSSGMYVGGSGGSNHLTDYEEGTFTPAISQGATNTQQFSASGRYTKVGRQVYVQFLLQWSGQGDGNQFRFNMPFTSANDVALGGGTCIWTNIDGLAALESIPLAVVQNAATLACHNGMDGNATTSSSFTNKAFYGVYQYEAA